MKPETVAKLNASRRVALYFALALALLLLGLDRYAAYAHRPAPDSTRVVIYTTTWCPYCAKLRTGLTASGIPYAEHDVEKSFQGILGFWTLRARGVPVSAVGPEVVHGYDVARLTAALAKLGYTFHPVETRQPDATQQSQSKLSR